MNTVPNETELAKDIPTITLAGIAWPVPLLAFRQNKIVVPILVRITKPGALDDMNENVINDLGNMAFQALTKAHQTLTRNEFEDMSITIDELVRAIDVIAVQTGLLVKGEAKKSVAAGKPSTSIS